MKLAEFTWPEVRSLSPDTLVVVPTGSVEQHGPHLPLVTDTLLVTTVTEAAMAEVPEVLVAPTLWLGASLHHLPFAGTLSAQFLTYELALTDVLSSLTQHGFWRFLIVNGHGGNSAINAVTLRKWKSSHPSHLLGHVDYYDLIPTEVLQQNVRGPAKEIHHACVIETSLMLHIAPTLVRFDRAVDDGLVSAEGARGLVWNYDEVTEQGPFGFATLATPELGSVLFKAAVDGLVAQFKKLSEPVALLAIQELET